VVRRIAEDRVKVGFFRGSLDYDVRLSLRALDLEVVEHRIELLSGSAAVSANFQEYRPEEIVIAPCHRCSTPNPSSD
jgi:hypothetical protein